MNLLHIAACEPDKRIWTDTFRDAVAAIGHLKIISGGERLPEAGVLEHIRQCQVLLTAWGTLPVPVAIVQNPGELEYICHITGTVRGMVPLEVIQAGIPVTNWGDAPAFGVAEGAMALLLAMLKNLRSHIEEKRAGRWPGGSAALSGSLRGLRLGIFGLGAIGGCFCELVRPFGPRLLAFDPFQQDWPADVERLSSLEELFRRADAIVIHAGLTPKTRGIVTAALLELLPDGGIIINTARGDII